MNALDVIILIFIFIPAVLGYKKGLIKSSVSLISLMLGIYLSIKFYRGLTLVVGKVITDDKAAGILSFAVLLVMIYIAGTFIGKKLSDLNLFTKTIDKLGGIILGGLTGLIIIGLILTAGDKLGMIPENTSRTSRIYPYISEQVPRILSLIGVKSSIINDNVKTPKLDTLKKK